MVTRTWFNGKGPEFHFVTTFCTKVTLFTVNSVLLSSDDLHVWTTGCTLRENQSFFSEFTLLSLKCKIYLTELGCIPLLF